MTYSFYANLRNGKTIKHEVNELNPSTVSDAFKKMESKGDKVTEIAMNVKTYDTLIKGVGEAIEDGRLWTASIIYDNSLADNTFDLSSNKNLNRYK